MQTLLAFHNDPVIKAHYLARVDAHRVADDLRRGMMGQGGKGCAIWCTLDAYEHDRYPIELGIPEWLAYVEDRLFEGMSHRRAMAWPRDFLSAIEPGADLKRVQGPFLVHVLRSTLKTFDHEQAPAVVAAVEGSIALWQRTDCGSVEWEQARRAARRAARDAADAALSPSAAALNAAYAAYAARCAADAAWSAADAAWSAGHAAASAGYADRSAAYDDFADALLAILSSIHAA